MDIVNIWTEFNWLQHKWTCTGDPEMKKEANVYWQRLGATIATDKQENWHHFYIEVSDGDI